MQSGSSKAKVPRKRYSDDGAMPGKPKKARLTKPKEMIKGQKGARPRKYPAGAVTKRPSLPEGILQEIQPSTSRSKGPAVPRRLPACQAKGTKNSRATNADESDSDEPCAAGKKCVSPSGAVDWVLCDGGCKLWFHVVCVGLKRSDIKHDEDFFCQKCVGRNVEDIKTEAEASIPFDDRLDSSPIAGKSTSTNEDGMVSVSDESIEYPKLYCSGGVMEEFETTIDTGVNHAEAAESEGLGLEALLSLGDAVPTPDPVDSKPGEQTVGIDSNDYYPYFSYETIDLE